MKAGRELDALVAEKVMGWHQSERQPYIFHNDDGYPYVLDKEYNLRCPHSKFLPSTSIAAAWRVVEKFCDEKSANFPQDVHVEWNGFHWFCYLNTEQMIATENDAITADTAPLAICLAALKAVESVV